MVIIFTFERTGAGVPTHTLQGGGYVEFNTTAHDDGSTDGRLSVAYIIATEAGAVSYQAYTSSTGSPVARTGIYVIQAGTFSTTGIVTPAGVSNIGTQPPNPPNPSGLDSGIEYLCVVVGAWHLSSAATVTVGLPTDYTNLIDVSGSVNIELAAASRAFTGPTVENTGAFTDNVTPNGTVSFATAIPESSATTFTAPTPTGGLEAGGTAPLLVGWIPDLPTGGLSVGGTAPVEASLVDNFEAPTPTGGLVSAGVAGRQVGFVIPEQVGGLTAGGAAVTSFGGVQTYTAPTPTGGPVAGGAGTITVGKVPTTGGGMVLAGTAPHVAGFVPPVSGGIQAGGVSPSGFDGPPPETHPIHTLPVSGAG